MEIFIDYVLPNLILFGGLYLVSRGVERALWHVAINYESLAKRFSKCRM